MADLAARNPWPTGALWPAVALLCVLTLIVVALLAWSLLGDHKPLSSEKRPDQSINRPGRPKHPAPPQPRGAQAGRHRHDLLEGETRAINVRRYAKRGAR